MQKLSFSFFIIGIILAFLGMWGIVNPLFFSNYLVQVFSLFFLIIGIKNLLKVNEMRKMGLNYGVFLFMSIIEILFGVTLFLTPFLSQIYLIIYIGTFILIKGILVLLNILFRSKIFDGLYNVTIGQALIDILFGVLLITLPVFSQQLIALGMAWYFVFMGIDFLVGGYQLKKES